MTTPLDIALKYEGHERVEKLIELKNKLINEKVFADIKVETLTKQIKALDKIAIMETIKLKEND